MTSTSTAWRELETHRYALAGRRRPTCGRGGTTSRARWRRTCSARSARSAAISSSRESSRATAPATSSGSRASRRVWRASCAGRAGGRNVVVDVAGREVEVLDEVARGPGRQGRAGPRPRPAAGGRGRIPATCPEGEPAPDGRRGGARRPDRRRAGDGLAAVLRPERLRRRDRRRDLEVRSPATSGSRSRTARSRTTIRPDPPTRPILAAALLAAGVVTPRPASSAPAHFWYGRRSYRCWKRGGHGSVDLHQAMQAILRRLLLHQRRQARHRSPGVLREVPRPRTSRPASGSPTRRQGLIPSTAWKKQRFGVPWYPGETVSASIGQGYDPRTPRSSSRSPTRRSPTEGRCSSLGWCCASRLGTGRWSRSSRPRSGARPRSRPSTSPLVRRGMAAVVEEPGGTGSRARVPGVRVGWQDGHGPGGSPRTDHGDAGEGDPDPLPRPRVVRGLRPGRRAGDRGGGLHRARAPRRHCGGPVAQRIMARYFEKKLAIAQGAAVSGSEPGSGG